MIDKIRTKGGKNNMCKNEDKRWTKGADKRRTKKWTQLQDTRIAKTIKMDKNWTKDRLKQFLVLKQGRHKHEKLQKSKVHKIQTKIGKRRTKSGQNINETSKSDLAKLELEKKWAKS